MTQLTQKQLNEQLFHAAYFGDIDAVKEALDKGANVHAKDKRGKTPLHNVAWCGYTEVVELLLENGADIHTTDDCFGWTPLHFAAKWGSTKVVELLIEKNANVNAMDNDGRTALRLAVIWDHTDIADLLKQHGGVA